MIITENRLERIAWTLRDGDKALEASATIHFDLSRGFIRAECFSYDGLMACARKKASVTTATSALKVRITR